MSSPNEIKKGTVINYVNDLWIVVDFQRVSPGKGGSFVRTKMKSLKTGKVNEVNFKAAENLVFEDVQYKKMQYLYRDQTGYTFMDNVSYEQVAIGADVAGDDAKYLKEGLEVSLVMHGEKALALQLPKKITYTVVSAPPAVKGDTASGNVTKEVELDNGMTARVPIFIKEGNKVVINTDTGDYTERAS